MHDEGLQVGVSFDPQRGYFTTGSELARSLTALSLGGLRQRIEALMLPDDVHIVLHLDRRPRLERDQRRRALVVTPGVRGPWPPSLIRRVQRRGCLIRCGRACFGAK
jgi:hypothetical protein